MRTDHLLTGIIALVIGGMMIITLIFAFFGVIIGLIGVALIISGLTSTQKYQNNQPYYQPYPQYQQPLLQEGGKYCMSCGTANPRTSQFCYKCGNKFP